jgi:hypothetical protein
LLEADALVCQTVNVGSLYIDISKAGKIRPAHIVDENEDDVGSLLIGPGNIYEKTPQANQGCELPE